MLNIIFLPEDRTRIAYRLLPEIRSRTKNHLQGNSIYLAGSTPTDQMRLQDPVLSTIKGLAAKDLSDEQLRSKAPHFKAGLLDTGQGGL